MITSSIAINSNIKPIRIAYATLAYFTTSAVTTPPIIAPIPEETSNATKNNLYF